VAFIVFINPKAMKNRAANFSCCPSPKHSRVNLNPLLKKLKRTKRRNKSPKSGKAQKGKIPFYSFIGGRKELGILFFLHASTLLP